MGIQINGNTNNINAGIGSLSIEDLNELDIVGVATAANFKTGVSNLHNVGLTLSGGQIDVGSNIKLGNAGVITATSFVGSGANLTGIAADKIFEGNTEVETVDAGGNGHIIFKTEGSEKARITQDGVLRITSGAGNTALTGTGNNFGAYIYRDTGSGRIYFDGLTSGSNTAGLILWGYQNGTYTHAFTHISGKTQIGSGGNSSRITVATNGNIGVGAETGTDFSLLDGMVVNAANGSAGVMINSSSSSHNAYLSFSYGSGSSTSHADQYSAYIGRVGDNTLILGTNNNIRVTVTPEGALVTNNIGLGTDAKWKIRPNNSNNNLALEYSTSQTLADTNIKAEFYNTGNVRFSTDTGAANGIKIYQNAIESQIYVPHFPELLTTGSPNPTGTAAGRMPYSTISSNNITIPANTYHVVMAGRKFYLPAYSSTTLAHNCSLAFDLNTMSYVNNISGMAESTVERIVLYFNANSSGDSTINRIVPLCNKMTLMASKRGYIGCTNASVDTYKYSSSASSSMPLASGDLWQTPGMMNSSAGSDYIRYYYANNGYSNVDIKAYLFWGRSPRAVTSNQNEGYIITGDRDAYNAGCSAQQWVMQASQNWASGGVGTCLDLALQVNAFA